MAIRLAQCGICEHFHECLGVSEFGLRICKDFKDKNLTIDKPLEWVKFTPQMEKTLDGLSITKKLYKMKTKDKIAVMQAYIEGKPIQFFDKGWLDIKSEPSWDWYDLTYRIKPESQYRPYQSAKEFIEDSIKHGLWLKSKALLDGENTYFIPADIVGNKVIPKMLSTTGFSFDDLFESYLWADDETPCGTIKEMK